MIQKKICLLGGFGVGKTSLVSRYVHSIFSDKYLTTVGVKIDKKLVRAGDTDVELVIWDIYGQDDYQKIKTSYLRGASGFLIVADGTRRATLDTALSLRDTARAVSPDAAFTMVINKVDLEKDWEVPNTLIDILALRGWRVLKTSAKTGAEVEHAFVTLAENMVGT